jgi:eukaryotic-like serine/threonine-protein kinase
VIRKPDNPSDPGSPGSNNETVPVSDPERLAAALARQTAEFDVLKRVAARINSTLDLEEIYDIALRTFDDLFEFHHALILLVEPGGDTLRVVASRGYENQAIGGRVKIGTGAVGIVAQKRRMLQLANLGQQRAYASAQRRQMMRTGLGADIGDTVPVPGLPNAESQIAIPLLIGDELVGVFSIESLERQAFDDHDASLVTIIANQIASAIRNAQLYDERVRATNALQAANASLEVRVAERTAALERELRVAEDLLNQARSRVDGALIGDSAAVQTLRDAVARQASRTEPLLLTGPPGAGKEAVAHALHASSGRKGAFIFVSCPELQSESRHTPHGSNTPARSVTRSLASKFELASGGTLFLEAVHELLPEHQRELREILERHERTRASGDMSVAQGRVIASTTWQGPREGILMPLLGRHEIAVPALKDRREDIPALVEHFVRRHARQLGKPLDGVSPASMRRLESYAWPGNIRELHTVLERAILVSKTTTLEIDEELLEHARSVGSYRLISLLGSGGMGEVWLAKHRLLARPAAVKLIRQEAQTGGDREQLIRRFQREAQVTAGLRSPHTVQLYDFGVNDNGSFYYVMELLQGLDLQHIVNRFGPLPAERTIMLLCQACRSLAEAHERGLVHRDIKPANLFVARLGFEFDYLKVLDFGMVKDQPGLEVTMLSAQNLLRGTPAFMAPEVVIGERDIDGRTDLYSLACAAYWALTGQLLFQANTPTQMLLHHVNTRPERPSGVCELPIPRDLEDLLMQCLEKDPKKRPASALDLERQLTCVPCPEPWTVDRARAWWATHAPDVVE